MKELLEQGYGTLAVGLMAGIGVWVRVVLFGYYGKLGKACREFGKTKNKSITYIREDLEFRTKSNIGMKNVMIYTECRLAECKVCGIRLGTLEGISEQSLLLVLLCSVLLAFAGVLWSCDGRQILFVLFSGGVSFFGLLLVDLFAGLREKHKRIRLVIRDYIENGEHSTDCPDKIATQKKSLINKESRKEKKRRLKQAKVHTAKCSRTEKKRSRQGRAQEEKRRLTEELLRERRQMEARNLEQLRRRELEEQKEEQKEEKYEEPIQGIAVEPMEQAQEEAAATATITATATGCTYESLLSEVLAEYLA